MEQGRKLAYTLASPYTEVQWPKIAEEKLTIELLCNLLEPIGQHRREHIKPSKGRFLRKRKRKYAEKEGSSPPEEPRIPQPPRIASHLTLGFNSTMRHLERLSASCKPQTLVREPFETSEELSKPHSEAVAPLAAVFVCRTSQSPILTSSLPFLIATASRAHDGEPPIRLISLSEAAEAKLAHALHQPRAGFVGLQTDAPGATSLIDLVRRSIQAVDVPWLAGTSSGNYLPVKIKKTDVKVGQKKGKATHDRIPVEDPM